MRTVIVILFFIGSMSFFSHSQKPVSLKLADAISHNEKTILLSDIAVDIRYIPLETTGDCLIGENFGISYAENAIIASSADSYSFYHFNQEGKFLNKIGQKGQGPGEYNVGLFYFLDFKNKHFYTHDWNDTYCYTYSGEFIKKITTPNLNMGTAEMLGENMIIYSNDMYFHHKKNEPPYQIYIVDMNGKQVQKMQGKVEEGKRYGINLSTRDFMYSYKGETYFKPGLENVVYKISSKKKIPVWKFDVGKKDIDVTKDETAPQKRLQSISVFQIKETENHLFVLYGLEKNTYLGMYDKSVKTFQNVRIVDDLSGGIDFIPAGKCIDGYLIYAFYPKTFKEKNRNNNGKLTNRVKEFEAILSMDNEDNPILVVAKLKR